MGLSWLTDPVASIITAILGGGAAAYGAKQSNKPQPLSPEQRWLFEEGKRRYEYSPDRDRMGSIMDQAMQQTYGKDVPGAGGFVPSFATGHFQGMQLPTGPKIDFTGLPTPWSQGRPAAPGTKPGPAYGNRPAQPPPKGPGGQSLPGLELSSSDDRYGGNREIVDFDPFKGNPAYSGPQEPNRNTMPLPGTGLEGKPSTGWEIPGVNEEKPSPEIFAKGIEWLRSHPELASAGQGAITGLMAAGIPGAMAYGIYRYWRSRQSQPKVGGQ